MTTLLLLVLLAPSVFCAIPHDYSSELTVGDLEEIYDLKALTDQQALLNQPFENFNVSSLAVTEDDVCFWIYSQRDPDGKKVLFKQSREIQEISSFRTSVRTKVIIHGWHNVYTSPVNTILTRAYLEKEDLNIIVVGWDGLARGEYIASVSAVAGVGKYVGKFLENLSSCLNYSLDNIDVLGHSLGAHVAGFAGKETKSALHSIIGLDPAGPMFLVLDPNNRLNENDAKYVMAIHTCGKLLGVSYNLAKADFWPNGGMTQNGCGLDVTGTCSHSRAYQYFAESISSAPDDGFISVECATDLLFAAGQCKTNSKVSMGGLHLDTSIMGTYYLSTNDEAPYAKGDIYSEAPK